jgi:hypothetical protein
MRIGIDAEGNPAAFTASVSSREDASAAEGACPGERFFAPRLDSECKAAAEEPGEAPAEEISPSAGLRSGCIEPLAAEFPAVAFTAGSSLPCSAEPALSRATPTRDRAVVPSAA